MDCIGDGDSDAYMKLCKEVEGSIVAHLGEMPRLSPEDALEILQTLDGKVLKEPSFSAVVAAINHKTAIQAVETFPTVTNQREK